MISKEEIENMKKYFNECITKDNVFEENLTIYFMSIATKYIQQLETKHQKVIDKLEEKIEMLEDVLDLCNADGKIAKYKIENLKEEIEDFKEILEIMKGDKHG